MRRKRAALMTLFLLTCLIGGIVLWLRAQRRQYALNRQLIAALVNNDLDHAFVLIQAGADPDTRYAPTPVPSLPELVNRILWRTPVLANHSDTALLIACGAWWNVPPTGYRQGIRSDAPALVRAMLKHGANINTSDDEFRETPLLTAMKARRPNIAGVLIANGANVNVADKAGSTPLMLAAEWPHLVRLLIRHEADVNARDMDGLTPLDFTANSPDLVRLLLVHGAEANVKNRWRQTPLMSAISHLAPLDTIRLLLEYGADVNVRDETGDTALNMAVVRSNSSRQAGDDREIIRLLLAHGADPNIPGPDGATPLARVDDSPDVAALLRRYGARNQ